MKIILAIRRTFIRILVPIFWKSSNKNVAAAMIEFSTTEFDSAWQNLYAMNRSVSDPKLRAKMFQHIVEETHHGSLFKKQANDFSQNLLPIPLKERVPLFNGETEELALKNFFALEYVCESEIHNLFATYAAAAPQDDLKKLFLRLEKDEIGHSRYAKETFHNLIASSSQRRNAIVKIKLIRLYEDSIQKSLFIGHVSSEILLSLIYYFLGFFSFFARGFKK